MSLRVAVHPDALRELGDAIEWYDRGGRQRGLRFRADYDSVLDRCVEWPESAAVVPAAGPARVFHSARIPHSHFRVVYYVSVDTDTTAALMFHSTKKTRLNYG